MVDDVLPPPVPRPQLALTTRLGLIALACAFIASFLPWVRVLFISIDGTDGDGMISAVTAAVGFAFVHASARTSTRPLILHSAAIVSAALTALVYVYNVADVSRTAADSTNSIFDMQISPQFGLIAGAVAAPIALFVTVVRLRDHLRERKDLPYAPWSRSDLLTGCLAVSTVPFALSPSLWAVSALLVIALALALWFGARRTDRVMACSVLTVIALVVAAGGTVHGLLRTDDGLQMSSDMSASLQGLDVEDLKDCVDVYTDGTPTSDLDEADLCMDDGVETYVFPITWECEDGRTLVSNDYGWGFAGDEWTTVGEAPFDRCRSSADRPCADIFVDGEPTREEWTDDYIECFDPDGDIDYVITSRWDCYDSTEVQLSNRYGWGYIGKEWVGSEDAPFC